MADVSFTLAAETKAAERTLQEFATKASQSLGQVESSTNLIGTAIKGLGALYAASKLGDFFASAISEASEAEQALTELNFALAAAGDYSKEASDQMVEFAGMIQATTKFSDDAVVAQAAFAKSLGLTNQQTKETIRAATQLATVTGQSLDSAVFQLSQTYEGQTGRLAKLVPALRGMSEEQLRAGAAIDYVNQRFGGAAEAMSNTYAGAISQVKNQTGDVMEAFGRLIIQNPLVIQGLKSLSELFRQLAGYLDTNKDSLISLSVQGIGSVIAGFAFLAKTLTQITLLFGQVDRAILFILRTINSVVTAFLDFKYVQQTIGMVTSVVAILTSALVDLLSLVTKIPGIGKALGLSKSELQDISLLLKTVSQDIGGFAKDTIAAKGANVTGAFSSGRKAILDAAEAGLDFRDKVARSIIDASDKAVTFGMNITSAAAQGKLGANNVADGFKNASKEVARFSEDVKTKLTSLKKELENSGLTNVQIVDKKYFESLETLQNALAQGAFQKEGEYADLLQKIKIRHNKELIEAQKKDYEELAKSFTSIVGDPLGAVIRKEIRTASDAAALGLSGASSVLQGRQGATKLIASGAGAAANMILPGSGAVVSEIVQALAQGPDAVKKMVREFARAIPDILQAIGEALPAAIQTWFEELPEMYERLFSETLPNVITNLAENLGPIIESFIRAMPRVALALAMALPRVIDGVFNGFFSQLLDGAGAFIQELVNGAGRFIEELGNKLGDINIGGGGGFQIGGAVGDAWEGAKDFFGLAEGGQIPQGFPNDNFPARLTSGEYVIDRDTTHQLQRYLAGAASGQGSQAVSITLKVGEQSLAKTLVNLDRRGFRV